MTEEEREAAIRGLFPVVRRIAARIRRMIPTADRDDLVSDGCVGAIKAVDSYDAQRGIPLERYAARVILGAMLNGLRNMDKIPERIRRELRTAERERFELAVCTGRMPTQREMEVRRPALRRAVTLCARFTPLSSDNPLPQGTRYHVDWSGDPARLIAERAGSQAMSTALASLPPRHRTVLTLHYVHGHSLRSIASAMEISPQRTSQLHLSGIRRLRAALHVEN